MKAATRTSKRKKRDIEPDQEQDKEQDKENSSELRRQPKRRATEDFDLMVHEIVRQADPGHSDGEESDHDNESMDGFESEDDVHEKNRLEQREWDSLGYELPAATLLAKDLVASVKTAVTKYLEECETSISQDKLDRFWTSIERYAHKLTQQNQCLDNTEETSDEKTDDVHGKLNKQVNEWLENQLGVQPNLDCFQTDAEYESDAESDSDDELLGDASSEPEAEGSDDEERWVTKWPLLMDKPFGSLSELDQKQFIADVAPIDMEFLHIAQGIGLKKFGDNNEAHAVSVCAHFCKKKFTLERVQREVESYDRDVDDEDCMSEGEKEDEYNEDVTNDRGGLDLYRDSMNYFINCNEQDNIADVQQVAFVDFLKFTDSREGSRQVCHLKHLLEALADLSHQVLREFNRSNFSALSDMLYKLNAAADVTVKAEQCKMCSRILDLHAALSVIAQFNKFTYESGSSEAKSKSRLIPRTFLEARWFNLVDEHTNDSLCNYDDYEQQPTKRKRFEYLTLILTICDIFELTPTAEVTKEVNKKGQSTATPKFTFSKVDVEEFKRHHGFLQFLAIECGQVSSDEDIEKVTKVVDAVKQKYCEVHKDSDTRPAALCSPAEILQRSVIDVVAQLKLQGVQLPLSITNEVQSGNYQIAKSKLLRHFNQSGASKNPDLDLEDPDNSDTDSEDEVPLMNLVEVAAEQRRNKKTIQIAHEEQVIEDMADGVIVRFSSAHDEWQRRANEQLLRFWQHGVAHWFLKKFCPAYTDEETNAVVECFMQTNMDHWNHGPLETQPCVFNDWDLNQAAPVVRCEECGFLGLIEGVRNDPAYRHLADRFAADVVVYHHPGDYEAISCVCCRPRCNEASDKRSRELYDCSTQTRADAIGACYWRKSKAKIGVQGDKKEDFKSHATFESEYAEKKAAQNLKNERLHEEMKSYNAKTKKYTKKQKANAAALQRLAIEFSSVYQMNEAKEQQRVRAKFFEKKAKLEEEAAQLKERQSALDEANLCRLKEMGYDRAEAAAALLEYEQADKYLQENGFDLSDIGKAIYKFHKKGIDKDYVDAVDPDANKHCKPPKCSWGTDHQFVELNKEDQERADHALAEIYASEEGFFRKDNTNPSRNFTHEMRMDRFIDGMDEYMRNLVFVKLKKNPKWLCQLRKEFQDEINKAVEEILEQQSEAEKRSKLAEYNGNPDYQKHLVDTLVKKHNWQVDANDVAMAVDEVDEVDDVAMAVNDPPPPKCMKLKRKRSEDKIAEPAEPVGEEPIVPIHEDEPALVFSLEQCLAKQDLSRVRVLGDGRCALWAVQHALNQAAPLAVMTINEMVDAIIEEYNKRSKKPRVPENWQDKMCNKDTPYWCTDKELNLLASALEIDIVVFDQRIAQLHPESPDVWTRIGAFSDKNADTEVHILQTGRGKNGIHFDALLPLSMQGSEFAISRTLEFDNPLEHLDCLAHLPKMSQPMLM